MSDIPIIIQARMNSTRVPGKVLREIAGKPILAILLQRLDRSTSGFPVVATSVQSTDDPIAAFCKTASINVFRGPLEDVAMRFCEVVTLLKNRCFVRICADSPLLDPKLIDEAVEIFMQSGADLVTNIKKRTFPVGQSIEVLKSDTYFDAYKLFQRPNHFEHVTSYYYEHPEKFDIHSIISDGHHNDCRMVVDTESDLERLNSLLATLERPIETYGWRELMSRMRVRTA
jgi:spore coat polysaccharide biosynthesis protein SpsF